MQKATKNQISNQALAGLLLAGGFGLIYMLSQSDKVTAQAKADRAIQFIPAYAYNASGGSQYANMAGLGETQKKLKISTVPIPMVDYAHYQTHQLPGVQAALDEIDRKYGNIIYSVQGITRVPYDLIKTMIFIESAGNERAVSHAGAIGLMQLLPDTAVFVLAMENIKKRLSLYEQDWLRETLGARMDCILKMRNLGTEVPCRGISKNKFVTREDLFNPWFNIMCGAIFCGILLDESLENDLYRVDKMVVRYNMGYNVFSKGKGLVGSPNQLVAKLPAEPAAFVKKLVGKNGLLTLV